MFHYLKQTPADAQWRNELLYGHDNGVTWRQAQV